MIRRIIVYALIVLLSTGCTTLRPVNASSNELQQRINSGGLLRVGDELEVVTSDGKIHQLTVARLGDGRIEGRNESINVDQVASLRKREFSGGRTLALIGGVAVAVVLAVAASHPAPHFTP